MKCIYERFTVNLLKNFIEINNVVYSLPAQDLVLMIQSKSCLLIENDQKNLVFSNHISCPS